MTHFKIITIIFSLFIPAIAHANSKNNDSISIVDRINLDSTSTIDVVQPQGLNYRILNENIELVNDSTKIDEPVSRITAGKQLSYRILAFNKANQRNQAMKLSKQINTMFPQYGAKVTSNLPYWQVWVGTFFNEEDAERAKAKLKSAFPNQPMIIRKKNIIVTR